MKIKIAVFFAFFFVFTPVSFGLAAVPGDVVINEIAWMGSPHEDLDQAPGNEWIELYNNTDTEILLDGWILKSTDDTPTINLRGTIAARGFFLLERTDDTSVPDKQADQIYTGALGNEGEHLELRDAPQGNLIGNLLDDVNAWKSSWVGWGGDNDTKQTMERKNPVLPGSEQASWATSVPPGGTPKAQNSVYAPLQTQGSAPSNSEPSNTTTTTTGDGSLPQQSTSTSSQSSSDGEVSASTQESTLAEPSTTTTQVSSTTTTESSSREESKSGEIATTTTSYPSNLFINELMPSPTGPDELEEWVEIVNQSTEQVDISGWAVQDSAGVVNAYLFLKGSTIAGGGFLVLSRPTTQITLNNDVDTVELLNPNKQVAHMVQYENAPKGKSYARQKDSWQWSNVPTPGSANIIPQQQTQPTQPSQTPPQQVSRPVTQEEMQRIMQMYEDAGKTPPQGLQSLQESATQELELNALELGSEPESEDDLRAKQIASITEGGPKIKKGMVVFIAVVLALFSAVFIFLLKKRTQNTL